MKFKNVLLIVIVLSVFYGCSTQQEVSELESEIQENAQQLKNPYLVDKEDALRSLVQMSKDLEDIRLRSTSFSDHYQRLRGC